MICQAAKIDSITIGTGHPLALLAGPCVIESREHSIMLAAALRDICNKLSVPFVFKASFDKANRSSISSFRGPGLEDGLATLAAVKDELGVPVVTDIHEAAQAAPVGQVVDCIQIPAFLCRQTDLLVAAAETGRCVNVKKGQFMSPEEMENVATKLHSAGCTNFMLTERGTFFGYHRLVNDMTAIPRMQAFAPVVYDGTHSCQMPGGAGTQSAGQREFADTLTAAAVAAGTDCLFMEVHNDPPNAKSDPATVYPLEKFEALLNKLNDLAGLTRDAAAE